MPGMLGDKLLLFLYMTGRVPISMKSGARKRITDISDLKFLGYRAFDFHSEGTAEVRDDRFYRLLARIAKRHSRGYGPSLELLVDELGASPLVAGRFGRDISYDDVLSPYFLLVRYLTGNREITVTGSGKRKKMKLQSTDDLQVLSKSAITHGADTGLQRLLNRVLWDNRRGGLSWHGLVDKAGGSSKVTAYFGRRITYGDVSRPTPEHDRQLLQWYLTGKIPVSTREGSVVPRSLEDLRVFRIYENTELSNPDRELVRLYLRTRSRKKRGGGQGFVELFDRVGKSQQVVEIYGRPITYRDVVLESLLHSCAGELEDMMLGKRELVVGGFPTSVSAVRDLPFLRPDWALADPQVKRLRSRIQRHTPETGMAFYDLVDRVGRRPAIMEQFGREISRFDVNPNVERYASRRTYATKAA